MGSSSTAEVTTAKSCTAGVSATKTTTVKTTTAEVASTAAAVASCQSGVSQGDRCDAD
jgi:hypothetical protein